MNLHLKKKFFSYDELYTLYPRPPLGKAMTRYIDSGDYGMKVFMKILFEELCKYEQGT